MNDNVNSPAHYKITLPRCNEDGELETIEVKDIIADRLEKFEERNIWYKSPSAYYHYGNVLKYVMRWFAKGGPEDLKKARKYIDFLLEELE